jgi:aspartyl protease family protein
MRNILVFAAFMIGLGTYLAQKADSIVKPATVAVASSQSRTNVMSDASPTPGRRSHTIGRDSRGHYSTDGRVDGRRLDFMVDTGASVIALTESSAARVGIRPSRSDYNAPVSTANGVVKAARARLDSVDIGGLEVRDVDAMVLPDGVLSENLLGLSYLSRLRRFEFAGGKLVLEQ